MKSKKYKKIITKLIKQSDFITFHIPNYGKILKSYDDIHEEEYTNEFNEDYLEYRKHCLTQIKEIQDDIIEVYNDTDYCTQSYEYELEIYVVRTSTEVEKFLLSFNHFNEWQYPNMPEDLCFYKGNKCLFESITHENMYNVRNDLDKVIRILEKCKSHFYIFDEDEGYFFKDSGWHRYSFQEYHDDFDKRLHRNNCVLKMKRGRYKEICLDMNSDEIKEICRDQHNCLSEVRKLNFLEYLMNYKKDIQVFVLLLEVICDSHDICDDKQLLFDSYLKYGIFLFGESDVNHHIQQSEIVNNFINLKAGEIYM